MRPTLPDLRALDNNVTIEHCSVLQERLGQVLEDAYPGEDLSIITNRHLNPERMLAEMLELFTSEAFMTMFQTEMGKGVIIGAFIQKYIFSGDA